MIWSKIWSWKIVRLAWNKLQTELKYLEEEGLIRCVVEKRMVKRKKSDTPLGKLSDNPRNHLVKQYFLNDKGVKLARA